MSKNTKELVLTSMLSAIIIIMSIVPQIGFITVFSVVGVTIIHIPVLVGIMTLKRQNAIILGLVFGLGSLFAALTRAASPFDLAFQNPLISVLPRVLFTWIGYEIFQFSLYLNKKMGYYINFAIVAVILGIAFGFLSYYLYIFETFSLITAILSSVIIYLIILGFVFFQTKKRKELFYVTITALFSTLIHSTLVLSAIIWIDNLAVEFILNYFENVNSFLYTIMMTNGLLESVLGVLVVTPIISALKIVMKNE